MTSLGLIETKGLLAAIEGADAMLKAADVRLLEKNLAGGGLVTITVAGEVSAVRAAVDAAASAIGRINAASLVSGHVIARPGAGLDGIISLVPAAASQDAVESDETPEAAEEEQVTAESAPAESAEESVPAEAETKAQAEEPASERSVRTEPVRHGISQLKKMNVSRLRQIARSLSEIALTPAEIKSANKKNLIDAIVNAYRQIEE